MKYSEQELIDELHRVSEEHCDGETPRIKDLQENGHISQIPYRRCFGSWNSAIKEAGFGVNSQTKISKGELKKNLIEISKEYRNGKPPRERDVNKYGKYSVRPYKTRFGSWNDVLKEFGFDLNKEKDVSKDRLIQEIQSLSKSHGERETLKQETMEKYGKFSSSIYYRKFGSWNLALLASGLKLNHNMEYSRKDLINEIERVSENYCYDDSPTQEDMEKHGKYSLNCYHNIFGTWNKALEECGYEPNNRLDISDDELIEEIQRVVDKLDTTPSVPQMKEFAKYSRSIYRTRFGSWDEAVEEAGFEPNKRSKNNLKGEEHPEWKGGWEDYYGPSWWSQRKRTWKRDEYRCRVCGITKEELGRNPDVHHIKPKYKWNVKEEHEEMNSLENLICLCPSHHKPIDGKWKELGHKKFEKKAKEYFGVL